MTKIQDSTFKTRINEIRNILITDEVDNKCVEILQNNGFNVVKNTKLSKETLIDEIKKYECLIVRSATQVTADILSGAASSLKLVARAGTGVDNIDVPKATDHGILVMNAVGSNTISAAELTCAMLMNLARRVPQANQSLREGKWERSKFVGCELFGKTLAIIGLGRIGREVSTRMKSFGMRVIGYDPLISADQAAKMGIEFMQLSEIWPLADFISIHVPLMEETKNLLNENVFAKCKKGFRVVNCARGGIINETDLLKALNDGTCAGAGIDVFSEEPTKNFELVNHPNTVSTPHIGASTKEAQNRVAIDIAEQIVKLVKSSVLDGGVNMTELKIN